MGQQTDEILSQITDNTSDENTIEFIDETDARWQLRMEIEAASDSLTKFATECAIQPSQLSEFFSNRKKLGRNKLLAIFIKLRYDLDKTQTMLHRLNTSELYVRNKRDYQIALGIKSNKTIDEIDFLLDKNGMEPIIPHGRFDSGKPDCSNDTGKKGV